MHLEGFAQGPNSLQGSQDSPEAKRLLQKLYQPLKLRRSAQAPQHRLATVFRRHIRPQPRRASKPPLLGLVRQDYKSVENFRLQASRIGECLRLRGQFGGRQILQARFHWVIGWNGQSVEVGDQREE